ncbi:PEP-utilizing enzyme [Candidatus Pelagibacter sp.]|jgi:glutamine kinase|nr:PEP-utilizing enzyme [Candidatus Pelagibacter sp.]
MKLSTKSKNLEILRNLNLKKSNIPNFISIKVQEWNENYKILKKVKFILNDRLSVRSSFYLEDSKNSSMAGEFDSFLDVKNNKKDISYYVEKLIRQYKKKSRLKHHLLESEIIIQNYIKNSSISGVVTTKCLKDGTDYYVVNYDDQTKNTYTVTSGNEKSTRVLNVFKKNVKGIRSSKFKKIIYAIKEIESKFPKIPLDIEFALDDNNIVNIFQIRPLSTSKNWKKISEKIIYKSLNLNKEKFNKIFKNNLEFGNLPIFGLMPDWNPVEIIGYQPNQLSYSIYKKVITDSSWRLARSKMGYKNINKQLMYSFAGKPYIDTRLSFNSMIPEGISKNLTKKLVLSWSKLLIKKPYLHDKIEFEIVDGSYDASFLKKVNKKYNFLSLKEKKQYTNEIKDFTKNQIINSENNFIKLDNDLYGLEQERIKFVKSYLRSKNDFDKKNILNFISKIKNLGTIPFSIYARHAFIAKKFFKSLVNENVITNKTYSKLLNSVGTITNEYIKLKKVSQKNIKYKKKFYNYFFHLRPGTYDININRYNKKISNYKIDDMSTIFSKKSSYYMFSKAENHNLNKFFKKNSLDFTQNHLLKYFLASIKMRENSKFIFTRALSDLIEILKKFGDKYNITKKKLSKLSLNDVLSLDYKNKNKLINIIKKNEHQNQINNKIKLPYLITTKDDFFISSILLSKPNFITKKIIKGNLLKMEEDRVYKNISNKIILIEKADPGFDWIFSKKIKGLITKYGGVNSHMTIRCEELNVPAAIGIGEDNFNNVKNYSNIILNCKNEQFIEGN